MAKRRKPVTPSRHNRGVGHTKRARAEGRCPRCACDLKTWKGNHRPTVLTPEIQAEVMGYLAYGNLISTACRAAGISESVYCKWRIKADEGEEFYAQFFKDVDIAFAQGEVELVRKLSEAASAKDRDNKALSFILERTRRDGWGAAIKVDLVEAKMALLDVANETLDEESFAALLVALERHGKQVEADKGLPGRQIH